MVVKPTFQPASKESCRRFKACWGTETECGRLWARLIGTEAVVALGSHRIVAASTGAPSIRMGTWLASIGCEKVMASVPRSGTACCPSARGAPSRRSPVILGAGSV